MLSQRSAYHWRATTPARLVFAWALGIVMPLSLLAACGPSGPFGSGRAAPATAHERYANALRDAGLDSTALGREWLAASDSALRAPLSATLPAREVGVYDRDEARAVAYRVTLREGERLRVSLRAVGLPARLYLDLFESTADSSAPFVHRATADTVARDSVARNASARDSPARTARASSSRTPENSFEYQLAFEATRNGEFVLRLQPELLRSGTFELNLRAEPMFAFPVDGRGNDAIQSFFGVGRDGGRRRHHGIDIFAPRGTPVLAATDGVVRSISPNTLGGNVIWLVDERRRQTLYYAHLDRHAVQAGDRVQMGDTIGFVGNTGNARTTPPHLHFGLYRRGQGPIDPLRYVRLETTKPPALTADAARLGRQAMTRGSSVALRAAPSASSAALRQVSTETALQVMGVQASWYRVQLEDGSAGYMTAAAFRLLDD